MNDRQKRIAIVDDDPRIAEIMQDFLADEGYDVVLCADCERVLPTIESLRPDAIVLDVRMAGINGLGILYLLSKEERTRDIPVLLCTASSTCEMQAWEAVLEQKGIPVLFKPFSLADLGESVSKLLDPAARSTPTAMPGDDTEPWQDLFSAELPSGGSPRA